MTEDRNDPEKRDELRRQAKARLAEESRDEGILSDQELRNLVHELRVHQIELEMQNEELRRAEEELQEARDRYADLYDFAPVGYFSVGVEGLIEDANQTAASLLGVGRRDLVGRRFSLFVYREDQDAFYFHHRRMREGSERETWELRLRKGDGFLFWAQLDCRVLTDAEGRFTAFRSALTDITERRQMEQERIRNQRLRAVGELAAGASHNLNNILTSVLVPAHLLRRMADDPDILQEVDDIIAAGQRARDLVHRLHLSVLGEDGNELQPVAVDEIVQEVVYTTRPRWKDESESKGIAVEVVTRLGDPPPVRGTPSGLHDILTNLLLNAVEAMPGGGTISIHTQAVQEGVQLTFSDTGTGMEEETRQRVFEPFFTTKMNVGTGLGLSSIYGTLQHWGGDIRVKSAPGQGTTFIIQFPAWSAPQEEEEQRTEVSRPSSGRLLVVDDDSGVRRLLARLLKARHQVETAADGKAALEIFAAGKYDTVLVDLGMIGMPGDRVMRFMRQADLAVGLVLITGWELPEGDPRQALADFQLQKPFDDLDRVETVVDRAVELSRSRSQEGN